MNIWNSLFWRDVAERVIATVVQVLIAVLSVDGLDLLQVDWKGTLLAVLIAAVLVVLKAVAAAVTTQNTLTVSPASFATDERGK